MWTWSLPGRAEVGDGLRCIHVLRELGFADGDFVDYAGLLDLRSC